MGFTDALILLCIDYKVQVPHLNDGSTREAVTSAVYLSCSILVAESRTLTPALNT